MDSILGNHGVVPGDSLCSPSITRSRLNHCSSHMGRELQPGSSLLLIGTTGKSRGTTRLKDAPEMSRSISAPRPRRRMSVSDIASTLTRNSKVEKRPTVPDIISRAEWCRDWLHHNKNASMEERSFVVILKSYGLCWAESVARGRGSACDSLIAEAHARGF